jgi:hypothetical protein
MIYMNCGALPFIKKESCGGSSVCSYLLVRSWNSSHVSVGGAQLQHMLAANLIKFEDSIGNCNIPEYFKRILHFPSPPPPQNKKKNLRENYFLKIYAFKKYIYNLCPRCQGTT